MSRPAMRAASASTQAPIAPRAEAWLIRAAASRTWAAFSGVSVSSVTATVRAMSSR